LVGVDFGRDISPPSPETEEERFLEAL